MHKQENKEGKEILSINLEVANWAVWVMGQDGLG